MAVCIVGAGAALIAMVFLRKWEMWEQARNPCRALLIFCIFGVLSGMSERAQTGGAANHVKRNGPGEGELETEAVAILPEEETEYEITFRVPERSYTGAEKARLLERAKSEIAETFCGENVSTERILENPVVSSSYQNGAVSAEWEFSDSELISFEGEILQEALDGGSRMVEAFVRLQCGDQEELYEFPFRIVPRKKSKGERLADAVQKQIDGQRITEEEIELPQAADGAAIEWKRVKSSRPSELFGLGILAAAAVYYAQQEEKQKKIQKRKRRLLLEYPEFVSKLSLLLGSGMNISGAFRRMNGSDQRQRESVARESLGRESHGRKRHSSKSFARKSSGKKVSPVYEELNRMICELDNGVGEMRAYQNFSARCDLQPYRKLVSLLLSSQKMGNRRLTQALNEEADRVFSERKNMARKLGEEAGAKLLLPMLLMLLIVMGIVLIPAFLSIYQM